MQSIQYPGRPLPNPQGQGTGFLWWRFWDISTFDREPHSISSPIITRYIITNDIEIHIPFVHNCNFENILLAYIYSQHYQWMSCNNKCFAFISGYLTTDILRLPKMKLWCKSSKGRWISIVIKHGVLSQERISLMLRCGSYMLNR